MKKCLICKTPYTDIVCKRCLKRFVENLRENMDLEDTVYAAYIDLDGTFTVRVGFSADRLHWIDACLEDDIKISHPLKKIHIKYFLRKYEETKVNNIIRFSSIIERTFKETFNLGVKI